MKKASVLVHMTQQSLVLFRHVVWVAIATALAEPTVAQDKITFTTEDYPPYNFRVNGVYKGAGYDQVVLIMKEAGIDYTVELMPWARAYALAQSEPNTCVFTTAHTPERDTLFKWVEPLSKDRNVMTAKVGSGVQADNIEQARQYRVGTQRDDYTQAFLEKNGFQKIDLASSMDLTLKKLESGRIDLTPISERFIHELIERGHPLEQKFTLTQQIFSIACNHSVPDEVIAKMQASLTRLIANGEQKRIFKQYGMMISE